MNDDDIMKETGKNDKIFTTTPGTFLNSDSIFVEYEDVMQSPMFTLIYMLYTTSTLDPLFDMERFKEMDLEELYIWYITRPDKNPFKSLEPNDYFLANNFDYDIDKFYDWCDEFYTTMHNELTNVIDYSPKLNFAMILANIIKDVGENFLVKNVYIWHPIYNEKIKDFIFSLYGDKVKFVHGDIKDVIKDNKITENSTFVFSDMNKINTLVDLDLLNFSSVVIADTYGYNYDKDMEPKINIKEIGEKYLFKLDFFNNIYA